MPKKQRERFECPNCGAMFRAGRLACPECGSDAETGWKDAEEIDYMSVEIPDTWEEEPASRRPPVWFLVAALAAIAGMLAFALLR